MKKERKIEREKERLNQMTKRRKKTFSITNEWILLTLEILRYIKFETQFSPPAHFFRMCHLLKPMCQWYNEYPKIFTANSQNLAWQPRKSCVFANISAEWEEPATPTNVIDKQQTLNLSAIFLVFVFILLHFILATFILLGCFCFLMFSFSSMLSV